MSSEIEDLLTYARGLGLNLFVFCDRDSAVEYETIDPDAKVYRPTNRQGPIAIDARGHWRVVLPPRWSGHVLTRSPEFMNSVFLNFDLASRGYFHLHLITAAGIQTRSSLWLLWAALLARVLSASAAGVLGALKVLSTCLTGMFGALRILGATLTRVFDVRRMFSAATAGARQRIHAYLNQPKSRSAVFRSMMARRKTAYHVVPNRILLVTPSFGRGGSERLTIDTAQLLVHRGYDVCMLALQPVEPGQASYMNEIKALGLSIQTLPREATQDHSVRAVSEELRLYEKDLPPWLLNFFDAVARVTKDFRPAVVHCWLGQAIAIGGLAAGALGVPRIIAHQLSMVQEDLLENQQFYRDAYFALARSRAVTFASNSKAAAVDYERWLGFRRHAFRVLTNVLHPSTVRVPSAQEVSNFRTQLGLQPGARVVATMIRMVPEKDPELWVEAAAAIATLRPDVRFVIGGYGVLEDAVRRKVSELGLEDRITMLGAVTDVVLVYAATDIFMLSSRTEGLPCVLLEAQSAGCPVVATDVGGNAEAFQDGVTGHLVRHRSAQALAEAVLKILDNPDWARRARVEAPRYVEASFGPDPYLDKALEIYGLPRRSIERAGSGLSGRLRL
ncbi:MAG: glycosyltransferase [Rhizobiales bacterium]|nr:glycosyltransferase [Hyphomicrobiales bacterium]